MLRVLAADQSSRLLGLRLNFIEVLAIDDATKRAETGARGHILARGGTYAVERR